MNRIFLVGNITGNIYYDRLLIKGVERPYLRVILMSSRPRYLGGIRVVLWDEMAELYFPYLQRGSEIAVIGHLQTREHKGKNVYEIEASHLVLLRNIRWEEGEQERVRHGLPESTSSANNVFIIGEVGEDIHFGWVQAPGGTEQVAILRFMMDIGRNLSGLRVVVRGRLAEIAHPFLRKGSQVAVDGHLRSRDRETGQRVTEITAEHIAFLDNVDWEAGLAAQSKSIEQPAPEVE